MVALYVLKSRVGSLDAQPQAVAAGRARRDRVTVTQRAGEPLPRGERESAFPGLVPVAEEEARHAASLAAAMEPGYG